MKVPRHIVDARRESIAQLIVERGYLPVQDISSRFGISEATVRRDLVHLASQRRLTRTRGGALNEFNRRLASVDERRSSEAVAKLAIGRSGAALVRPGMTIYIDAGSTPLAVAEVLLKLGIAKLTVVTPSLAAAEILVGLPDASVHVPGGLYLGRQRMVAGASSAKALRAWSFDLAFVGSEGVNRRGLHNSQADIIAVTHTLLEVSERVVLCLTRSKIGASGPVRVVPTLDGFTLLTNATAREVRAARLPLGGCRLVHVATPER
ncbi:MAG: DeoR/GlpR family DNA-binding transcription regulator [Opitutia bacterium]|jgi:DeoR/GlpR family transcriptional regulator of sugar metabolism